MERTKQEAAGSRLGAIHGQLSLAMPQTCPYSMWGTWAKLTTASSFQGGPLVEVTPLSGAGDSSGTECGCIPGESSGAGQGLYPQDLLQGLNWGSSGAEDTGPEH